MFQIIYPILCKEKTDLKESKLRLYNQPKKALIITASL